MGLLLDLLYQDLSLIIKMSGIILTISENRSSIPNSSVIERIAMIVNSTTLKKKAIRFCFNKKRVVAINAKELLSARKAITHLPALAVVIELTPPNAITNV